MFYTWFPVVCSCLSLAAGRTKGGEEDETELSGRQPSIAVATPRGPAQSCPLQIRPFLQLWTREPAGDRGANSQSHLPRTPGPGSRFPATVTKAWGGAAGDGKGGPDPEQLPLPPRVPQGA